jgi:hypothetical protein
MVGLSMTNTEIAQPLDFVAFRSPRGTKVYRAPVGSNAHFAIEKLSPSDWSVTYLHVGSDGNYDEIRQYGSFKRFAIAQKIANDEASTL